MTEIAHDERSHAHGARFHARVQGVAFHVRKRRGIELRKAVRFRVRDTVVAVSDFPDPVASDADYTAVFVADRRAYRYRAALE